MHLSNFLVLAGSALASLPAIEISGNAFYYSNNNTRFYIRGVDYQPGGASNATDPLVDSATCKRDIAKFKELGANTIRVYTVDNSEDHTECMEMLAEAGIYLLLDVNTPHNSLNRGSIDYLKLSYNSAYLQSVFSTIDAFKNYTNVLGFFAANEVINNDNTTIAAPYIKAVVRDMKTYIAAQSDRQIPVGYSAADISTNRWQQMAYLNCGSNATERIDMFGMNDYSWCGKSSSFEISGYAKNVESYSNYSIPLFLSEFGCNTVTPRTFPEISSIYSTDMSAVYSGGLVYEYSSEGNNYGLVEIENSTTVTELDDYTNLKEMFASTTNPSGDGGAKTDGEPATCPSYEEGVWLVTDDTIPDTPAYAAKHYFKNGAGTALGMSGNPTQWGTNLDDNDGEGPSSSSSSASSSSSSSSTSSAKSSSSAASTSSASATSTSSDAASQLKLQGFGALLCVLALL